MGKAGDSNAIRHGEARPSPGEKPKPGRRDLRVCDCGPAPVLAHGNARGVVVRRRGQLVGTRRRRAHHCRPVVEGLGRPTGLARLVRGPRTPASASHPHGEAVALTAAPESTATTPDACIGRHWESGAIPRTALPRVLAVALGTGTRSTARHIVRVHHGGRQRRRIDRDVVDRAREKEAPGLVRPAG